jgi:hypothetical protein
MATVEMSAAPVIADLPAFPVTIRGHMVPYWLRKQLAGGARYVADVRDEARRYGIRWARVLSARQELGCRVFNLNGSSDGWQWQLPRARDQQEDDV